MGHDRQRGSDASVRGDQAGYRIGPRRFHLVLCFTLGHLDRNSCGLRYNLDLNQLSAEPGGLSF